MRATERYINFYDLVVKVRAKHAPIPSIKQLIAVWQTHGKEGGLVHERDKGSLRYRIGDIVMDEANELTIMLVRRADQDAPNATFSDLGTGKLRIAKKEANEGGDSAAHIVVSLLPKTPNTYLFLVESVPGLSHRIVQGLLNNLIRQACKDQGKMSDNVKKPVLFSYADPAGGKRSTPYQPHVELEGYLAEDLAQDLDEGTLRKVELVKSVTRAPLGGDQYLVETEYSLLIKPDEKIPRDGRLGRLRKACRGKLKEFDKARIVFKDRNDRSRTVEVSLEEGTAEQQLYVRSEHIKAINPPLDQSCETIQSQLSDRMGRLLMQQRADG